LATSESIVDYMYIFIVEKEENFEELWLLPNSFKIRYLGNMTQSLYVVFELSPMFRNLYTSYLVRVSSHRVVEIVPYVLNNYEHGLL
jgi:hypothetical protein